MRIVVKMLGMFLCLGFGVSVDVCFAQPGGTEHSQGSVKVRVDLGLGDGVRNYDAFIFLRTSVDPSGYGTATSYNSTESIKTNCDGDAYPYTAVSMDAVWTGAVYIPTPTGIVGHPVGPADCQRYWDWVYEGYEKVTDIDFSRNCHGYAFGVGNWPDTAHELLNVGPFIASSGRTACYEETVMKDATIASDPPAHSIIVEGEECAIPPGPGPTPFPGPILASAITESREQFRESGIYRQTSVCPVSVNLKKGKRHSGLNLKLYKPK